MKGLAQEEAWTLFKKMAGDSAEKPSFKPIAEEIVEICDGLPIAISQTILLNYTIERNLTSICSFTMAHTCEKKLASLEKDIADLKIRFLALESINEELVFKIDKLQSHQNRKKVLVNGLPQSASLKAGSGSL